MQRRPWRRTRFGHPALIDYVRRLGESARRAGLGLLLVGDASLPRGGAYMHGHFSHQTGLDVDIAYRTFGAPVTVHPAGELHFSSGMRVSERRDPRHLEAILRLAAADARVDRIFVGADIKQLLCRTVVSDRGFLRVLRPWWGHERHFHVRLKCPADSPECRPNEPMSSIPDDCRSLSSWWKSPEVRAAFARWRTSDRATYDRDLPTACQALPEPVVGQEGW